MSTANIAKKIKNWQMLKDESLSGHRFIQVTADKIGKKNIEKHVIKNDWGTFRELLKWKTGLGKTTSDCVGIAKEAYMNLQTRTRKTLRRPCWWNDDIDAQRVICIKKRRLLVRSNRRNRDGTANEQFRREYWY
nr:unnamed protein product [Callosobruchus analis]